MVVDEDYSLGLEYAQGAQRRHFPQGEMQRGDRDELSGGTKSMDQHEAKIARARHEAVRQKPD